MSEVGTEKSRGFDWVDVLQKAIAPVITALILGLLAFAWNGLSQGGLVRLLGGVTQQQFEARTGNVDPSDPYPLPGTEIPRGAIVGFYGDCPPGWMRASRDVVSIIGPKPDGTYAGDSLKSPSKKTASAKPSKNDFEAYAIFFCSKAGEELYNWGSPSK